MVELVFTWTHSMTRDGLTQLEVEALAQLIVVGVFPVWQAQVVDDVTVRVTRLDASFCAASVIPAVSDAVAWF